jgi:uncharacterized protein
LSVGLAVGIVAFGVLVGVLSALFGVGGGIALVPFMVLVLDMTQQTAEGTSLLVIVPTALSGVIAHRRFGFGSLRTAMVIGAGGVVGSWLGATLALRLPASSLSRGFGVLVIAVGLRIVVRGWTGSGPGAVDL